MTPAPIFTYPVRILENHLDAYGHVNHVSYFSLYELARWEVITSGGRGLEFVRDTGVGPIVLDVQVKFRKELKLRQDVIIKTQVETWRGVAGTLRQWMESTDGILHSEAKFTMGMFDLKGRRLVKADREWCRALGIPDEWNADRV